MVKAKQVIGSIGVASSIIAGGYGAYRVAEATGFLDWVSGVLARGQWTDNYRCIGTTRQRQWRYADGTTEWFDFEFNSQACITPEQGEWTNNYRCAGRKQERQWRYPDNSLEWRTWEEQSAECWVNVIGETYEEKILESIPNVLVKLTGRNYGGSYTVFSDGAGKFRIDTLIPDFYDVHFEVEGYNPKDIYKYDLTRPKQTANLYYIGALVPLGVGVVEVIISPSQAGSHRDWCCENPLPPFRFWLPRVDPVTIQVKVYGTDGNPFEKAWVVIRPQKPDWGCIECYPGGHEKHDHLYGEVAGETDSQGIFSKRYISRYEGGGDHPGTRQIEVKIVGWREKKFPYLIHYFKNPIVKYTNVIIDGALGSLTCAGQCEKDFHPEGQCWLW